MKKYDIKYLVIFLIFVGVFAFWLFLDKDSSDGFVATEKAIVEEERAEEDPAITEARNSQYKFYEYQIEGEQGEILSEFITLSPTTQEFIFETVVDYQPETAMKSVGTYSVSGNKIFVTINNRSYKGKITKNSIDINDKTYYETDDTYI